MILSSNQIAISDFFKANASKGINDYNNPPRSGFAMQTLEEFIGSCEDTDIFPGYRDGVILVRRPNPGWLVHDTVHLQEGDQLRVTYNARVPGEEPRKSISAVRFTLPAARCVFFVLYRADVLEETNERSRQSEWEVISALTSAIEAPEPMHPDTLIANHFQLSGGTSTKMNDYEFTDALRTSVLFWKSRAKAIIDNPFFQG
jgi:hypothetical protein